LKKVIFGKRGETNEDVRIKRKWLRGLTRKGLGHQQIGNLRESSAFKIPCSQERAKITGEFFPG